MNNAQKKHRRKLRHEVNKIIKTSETLKPIKYFIGDSKHNRTRIFIKFKDILYLSVAKSTFKTLKPSNNGYFAFTNKKEINRFESITGKAFQKREENFYTLFL